MSPDRVLLTLGVLAFAGVMYLLMLKGWRGRQRRQGDLPPPPVLPDVAGSVLVGATPGLFVGTVMAGDWLDRVAVHQLSDRSAGWLTVRSDGVVVEREGAADLYLPYDGIEDAGLGDALAGKVVGREGLLILTWRLGGHTLQSAFRADDHGTHRRMADAIRACLPASTPIPAEIPSEPPHERGTA